MPRPGDSERVDLRRPACRSRPDGPGSAALDDPNSAVTRALAGLGVDLDRARGALRDIDITGTSDKPPDEAGRRQMSIQVTDDQLTIRATDPTLLNLGRAALDALGDQREQPDTISGDSPAGARLGTVWQAIHDALEDIRRRAAARGEPTRPGTAGTGQGEGGGARPDEPGAAEGTAG